MMQRLHESTVQGDEIDSLGHMNVRYYMARMEQGNRVLIEQLGLSPQTRSATLLRRTDTYTRFRQEQFEGAPLHVYGGVLSVGEGGMQSYVEIRNPELDQVAATFIVTTALVDQATREPLPFRAAEQTDHSQWVEVPDYATPRSLSLGAPTTDISLAQLQACIPEIEGGGMMSGRREAEIETQDVDADGFLRQDVELMFLPFTRLAQQDLATQGPPVFIGEQGQRVGWAVMESRNMVFGQPRLGDVIAYFSADLRLEAKSRLSRRWAFNRDTGALLGMSDTVGLCVDLDARKAVEWPANLRADIEKHLQPQLL